jgi:uncharacterized protein YjiK
MKKIIPIAWAFLLLLFCRTFACAQSTADPKLKLVRDLQVCVEASLQKKIGPSGLTVVKDTLYFVSERHDRILFKGHVDTSKTKVEFVAVPFKYKEKGYVEKKVDFEGLAYFDKCYYLVNEATSNVIKIDSLWTATVLLKKVPNPLQEGDDFENNRQFEGIAVKNANEMYLAAERSKRGIVSLKNFDGRSKMETAHWELAVPKYPRANSFQGVPDIADLFLYRDRLFALERNDSRISELSVSPNGLKVICSWDFSESAHKHRYKESRGKQLGVAEGFAIDDRYIYIICDNNTAGPMIDELTEGDHGEPRLFVFNTPLEMRN